MSECVDPKYGASCGRAYQFPIDDLQSARITGISAVSLVKIAVDGGNWSLKTGIHRFDLVGERTEPQPGSSRVSTVNLKLQICAFHSNNVNGPRNLGDAVIRVSEARAGNRRGIFSGNARHRCPQQRTDHEPTYRPTASRLHSKAKIRTLRIWRNHRRRVLTRKFHTRRSRPSEEADRTGERIRLLLPKWDSRRRSFRWRPVPFGARSSSSAR